MQARQLPMFGITLIAVSATRGKRRLCIELRRAGSEEEWSIDLPVEHPAGEQLARPGAVFALVELASVSGSDRA